VGSDAHAFVAVSSKYLSPKQGVLSTDPGACAKCVCLRLSGADTGARPGASLEAAVKYSGLTLAARVGDRWGAGGAAGAAVRWGRGARVWRMQHAAR
jgi:hypothetical protein